MILYHLAGPMLGAGSLILPGNFGRLLNLYGQKHLAWDREAALETWRANFYPSKPSRKRCVFAFLRPEDAQFFRANEPGFSAHRLYEVAPVDPDPQTHTALIGDFRSWGPDDTGWPDRYWREGQAAAPESAVGRNPTVGVVAELREILVGSPVRIHACLDDG